MVSLFSLHCLSPDLLQEYANASDTLAPELRLTRLEFKKDYQLGITLLSHRAVNKFIGDYIRDRLKLNAGETASLSSLKDKLGEEYRTEPVTIMVNGEERILEIPVVSIAGLLKNTGQFGHVGLGSVNNMPVIYIDSAYIETDAFKHDVEEVVKWETKRLELGKEYQEYRSFLNEQGMGRKLRDEFHNESARLDKLYDKAKETIKADKVYGLYEDKDYGGLDRDDSDFNIAAGAEHECHEPFGHRVTPEAQERAEKSFGQGKIIQAKVDGFDLPVNILRDRPSQYREYIKMLQDLLHEIGSFTEADPGEWALVITNDLKETGEHTIAFDIQHKFIYLHMTYFESPPASQMAQICYALVSKIAKRIQPHEVAVVAAYDMVSDIATARLKKANAEFNAHVINPMSSHMEQARGIYRVALKYYKALYSVRDMRQEEGTPNIIGMLKSALALCDLGIKIGLSTGRESLPVGVLSDLSWLQERIKQLLKEREEMEEKIERRYREWERSHGERRIGIVVPRTLASGYGKTLLEAFRELGSKGATAELLFPEARETISDFTKRVKARHCDLIIANLHGEHSEEPVAFEDFGTSTVILVHRPGEALERNRSGLYGEERWKDAFRKAAETVLFGPARTRDYKKFCPNVSSIPHGFTNIPNSIIEDKHLDAGVVIGGRTMWSEMRSIRDCIGLIKEVRRHRKGQRAFGYIAGAFQPYVHPKTRRKVDEKEKILSSGNRLVMKIKAEEIDAAYDHEGGFNDLTSLKKWLYTKLKGPAKVIIVEGDLKNKDAARLEASLIDFGTEMYHEIMKGFRPKDEYAAALHRNPGSRISVVLRSRSMRDLKREGIALIEADCKSNGSVDFTKAAKKIIGYISSPERFAAARRASWEMAKTLTTRHSAEKYLALANRIWTEAGGNSANSHPKRGGSPADYIIAVGENPDLHSVHTIREYKDAVKPAVSDSTIRRDRRTLEERGYLQKGEYQLKKGYEYSLTPEGMTRFELIDSIKQRAGNAVYGFVNAAFDLSAYIEQRNKSIALENGEKILFAMDEDLAREGTEVHVRRLIKDICGAKDGSEAIEKKLRNIIFVKGHGGALAKDVAQYTGEGKNGVTIKKENVIMITKAANEAYCDAFKDEATITFVDDSQLDSMDYYPFMEIALFTLAKALLNMRVTGYDQERLVSIYRSLPIEQVEVEQIIPIIIDNKVVRIRLRPVKQFNYDELQHIYRNIRELLQAA